MAEHLFSEGREDTSPPGRLPVAMFYLRPQVEAASGWEAARGLPTNHVDDVKKSQQDAEMTKVRLTQAHEDKPSFGNT